MVDSGDHHNRMAPATHGPQSVRPQVLVPSLNVSPEQRPNVQACTANFICQFCNRTFSTKSGLGVHINRAHRAQANELIVTDRSRKRWSDEEIKLLAGEEARLTLLGLPVNEGLVRFMSYRTLDSIKGQRKKQVHKDLVSQILRSRRSSRFGASARVSEVVNVSPNNNDDIINVIRQNIADLAQCQSQAAVKLAQVASGVLDGDSFDDLVADWIASLFPDAQSPVGPQWNRRVEYTGNSKEKRRQRYAVIQKLYHRNRRKAASAVLEDTDTVSIRSPDQIPMLSYWSEVFSASGTTRNAPSTVRERVRAPGGRGLWHPVGVDEIRGSKVNARSAAGWDGILPSNWNRMNPKVRTLLYNLFIFKQAIPVSLKTSRTIFLPKTKGGSSSPENFRPISVGSVIVRQFNKILTKRLVNFYKFDDRQSAYLPVDGVGNSTAILSSIIAHAKENLRELHVVCLDATKAFNSITHSSLIDTLNSAGCSSGFVNYVKDLYDGASTVLQYNGVNRVVNVGCGVLQGDPLSGPLFTMAFETALKQLNNDVGYRLNDVNINAIAYADDVVLVAGSRVGMQLNLDAFNEGLRLIGLCLNSSKSMSLSIVPSGKDKKSKVVVTNGFKVDGDRIPQKSLSDIWKYLGIDFEGDVVSDNENVSLATMLDNITKAPLKPQQRICLLKEVVVPRVMHKLVLGRCTASKLKRIDVHIRNNVRSWLKLPHDLPKSYFYTACKSGGLGLPCMQFVVPLQRLKRLTNLLESDNNKIAAMASSGLMERIVFRSRNSLAFLGESPTKDLYENYWKDRLSESCDGKDLVGAGNHKSSSMWNSCLSSQTSGEDYIHYHALRSNSIPTKVRTSRGRRVRDMSCRAGCLMTETVHHVIQQCHRTHGGRVLRHDRVVNMLRDEFTARHGVAHKEPRINTAVGLRKPDLIVVSDDVAYVVDVQIVKCSGIDESHELKRRKYSDIPDFNALIMSKYHVSDVKHCPCTISFKGIWSRDSAKQLCDLGVSEYCFHMIVTSVLRGSWLNWRRFNKMTTVVY